VNFCATWKFCERNCWTLRARADRELLLLGELVHTQDGDDVLEVGVLLQNLLHLHGHAVVLLAHDGRIERGARACQRVDGRIDAQLGDGTREDRGGVQVRERRCRGRVGQVVGGDVDGLDRGNGALLGGGDALLQLAHLGCQRGLVANCGRHAAEKGRDLGARLREAEDVVDEEQDVLALVAEVLGRGEASEGDTHTCSRRLVHLAVDQAGLVDDARLAHLEVEVGTLTGALANAREDGGAAVLLGKVVDELLDQDGLADASAAKEAGLAATDIRLEKVDGLDAGLEDLGLGGELVEGGRGVVDG
jgi:peptide chain release factor 1